MPILLCALAACSTGEGMDLRLFCDRYSEISNQAHLEPRQFIARDLGEGRKYEAYISETLLLTLAAGPDGIVHTISLTALPETTSPEFRRAAADVLKTFCAMENDAVERWLNAVQAGETEVLGYITNEESGFGGSAFRLTCAANAAGRYIRVSQPRFLPVERELPTIKNFIEDQHDGS